jgi:hypothetical protein
MFPNSWSMWSSDLLVSLTRSELWLSLLYAGGRTLAAVFTSAPIWISVLPIILHGIDKALEEHFAPLGERTLRALMSRSPQSIVSRVGMHDENFSAIRPYFEFQHRCNFVVNILLFNILSLYVAQFECMLSFISFNVLPFLGIVSLFAVLVAFLLKLSNQKISPAIMRPPANRRWEAIRQWERAAMGAFWVVLVIELILRFGPVACKGEETVHGQENAVAPPAVSLKMGQSNEAPYPGSSEAPPIFWSWTTLESSVPSFKNMGQTEPVFGPMPSSPVASARHERRITAVHHPSPSPRSPPTVHLPTKGSPSGR